MTTEFPAIFKVTSADTAKAERDALAGIDRIAQGGRRKLTELSNDAQRLLDKALSVQRNEAGAIDLQLDELRQAASFQEQRALASREFADAALRAAQNEGVFNAEMRESVAAARQYATAQDRLADELRQQLSLQDAIQKELNQTASATEAVFRATTRGAGANNAAIRSQGALRNASVQAGQQLQDITVQLEAGTRASTVFSQQVPQLAFALSGLRESANATQRGIGQFATFLSGPWGAAIFAATAVLGPYVAKLFETEDAAGKAQSANASLAEQLDAAGDSYEKVIRAIEDYEAAQARASQTTLQAAQAASLAAKANLEEAESERKKLAAKLDSALADLDTAERLAKFGGGAELGALDADIRASSLLDQVKVNAAELEALQNELNRTTFDLAEEQAKIQTDAARAIAEGYSFQRQELERLGLSEEEYRERLKANLEAEEQALASLRTSRGSRSEEAISERLEREAAKLRDFGANAAAQVRFIEERFVRVPLAVAQVNRSVADLDSLIGELSERKPPNFEALITQAEAVRAELSEFGVVDGLRLALADIRVEGAQQLEQQALILTGRQDEAEVLRIMAGLQRQFGNEVENQRGAVEAIVDARSREREELEGIEEQLGAYRQATQSIRQELEGLFSGEGADFERVFRRLQARISVEAIFGDALRQLDDTVQKEYNQAVERLSDGVIETEQALDRLVEALTGASGQIRGSPTQKGAQRARAAFNAEFDRAFGAVVTAGSNNQIVVQRLLKDVKDGVSGMSPQLYARLLGDALVTPLVAQLPDQISVALRNTLGPALGGLSAAGPAGAGIGLLEGLLGTGGLLKVGNDIAQSVSSAFEGLFTGTQTAAILTSLGVGHSSSGSALGGAVGSAAASQFEGILGSVLGPIGALAGGFLADAFSGQARGSARIGAQGFGIGVVGFFGGNSEREQQSAQYANTAIETIERLAQLLGTSLNTAAGRVSIGIRDDNIRVDTAGRGFTKLRGNPEVFDFGNDAEAAVLFAVQDLINDGVIAGLTAAEENLIRSGRDIEQSLTDILSFRSVFDRLAGLDNPLKAEIDALNSEFQDLIDTFERASASSAQFAELERLYDLERARLVEGATDRVAGSLQGLIDDLTIGDNGFSLRTRQANAQAQFDTLAARVAAGDASAFDDFEESARALLDIERQLFGSQERYFDRVEEILALSRSAADEQQAALLASAGLGSPFGSSGFDRTPIGIPIAEQTAELGAKLDAVNTNLGQLLRLTANGQINALSSSARSAPITQLAF